MQTIPYKTYLDESELPECWYNLRADMAKKPAPLLVPATGKPCTEAETASDAPTTVAARTARSTPKRYLPALSADFSARILALSSELRNLPPGLSHSCSTLHPCHSRKAWYVQSKPHSSKMDATSAI